MYENDHVIKISDSTSVCVDGLHVGCKINNKMGVWWWWGAD